MPTGMMTVQAAKDTGVRFVEEVYADPVYNPDGTLQSRKIPGTVIHDPEKAAQQALTMVQNGYAIAHDGMKVNVKPESICVHGDTPTAVAIPQKIRESLKKASIAVKAMEK